MSRPTDWEDVFGFGDPTPGDPYSIRQVSTSWSGLAEDAEYAETKLNQLLGDEAISGWIGEAGNKFREKSYDLPGQLTKCKNSYRMASDAMSWWAGRLESHQYDADNALVDGRAAKHELDAANANLDDASGSSVLDFVKKYGDSEPPAGVEVPSDAAISSAKNNLNSAQGAVHSAQSKLDAARKLASDAGSLREEDGRSAADDIREASDAGIEERSWWEKAKDWVAEAWDILVEICKIVVLVLGVVALILGGPLAWIVFAAAVVVLADTIMKYLNGECGLMDVLFAALDCIPGGKGLTSIAKLAKLAKGAKGAIAAKGTVKALTAAFKAGGGKLISMGTTALKGLAKVGSTAGKATLKNAIEGIAKVTCGDPVDVATGDVLYDDTDLILAGTFPLELGRMHVSSWRYGQWFGRSWASSFDERLVVLDEEFILVRRDGSMLKYPVPANSGEPVLPVHGQRWPLRAVDSGWEVLDPISGERRRFVGSGFEVAEEQSIPLVEHAGPGGETITYLRDERGVPIEVRHSGGYRVLVANNGDRITGLAVTDDAGSELVEVRAFTYSDVGDLAEVYNASGMPLRFSYDDAGRMLRWVDRNGVSYDYLYDEEGRCVDQGGDGGVLAFRYDYLPHPVDDAARVTVATNGLGDATEYHIDEASKLTREIDPLGAVTVYEYDGGQRLVAKTDPLGRRKTYGYTDVGNVRVVGMVDGSLRTTEFVTDAAGVERPARVLIPGGLALEFVYDEGGRVVEESGSVLGPVRYEYTPDGLLATKTEVMSGARTRFTCDAAGLITTVTDPSGNTVQTIRNALGHVVGVIDPLGLVTRIEVDTEGRTLSQTSPEGLTETCEYDPEGNLLRHVDGLGAARLYETGAFGELRRLTAPDGSFLAYAYDQALNPVSIENAAGLTWSFQYDAAGRRSSEVDFNGASYDYEYDAAGQVVRKTNGLGQFVAYAYGPTGLVEQSVSDTGRTCDYRYDSAGRVISADADGIQVSRDIDERGLLHAESIDGRTVTYAYDPQGRRTGRHTPQGVTSQWSLGADGLAEALEIGGRQVAVRRDDDRRVAGLETAQASILREYDALGRLARIHDDVSGFERAFEYGPGGALVATESDADRREFTWDRSGRVVAEQRHGIRSGELLTAFDLSGNADVGRDEVPAGRFAGTQLVANRHADFTYDAQGRLIRKIQRRLSRKPDVWVYEWDADDRLIGLRTPDGASWRYRYDALGRRVAKEQLSEGGEVVESATYTWDDNRIIERTDERGSLTWEFDGLAPLCQTETSRAAVDTQFFLIVSDLVGAPTELVNEQGGIAWRASRDLWGRALDPNAVELGFPGQIYDAESGLYYNVNRYYDPESARYLSPDPIGAQGGPNPTAYVPNPLESVDPEGLACIKSLVNSVTNYANIDTYKTLRATLKSNKVTGMQVHHLIEQRLRSAFPHINVKDYQAIVMTPKDHQVFTNAWRAAIPYGTDYTTVTVAQIRTIAADIYKDYPDIMKILNSLP